MRAHGWTGRAVRGLAMLVLGAACWQTSAPEASAQSRYACDGLETASVPLIEGEGGIFFRMDTDILSETRFAPEVVNQIAGIARAFEARGVQLVVAPLPTKGLLFPEALGDDAEVVGFDVALARTLYDNMLERFAGLGVRTVDALAAFEDVAEPVLKTDPRATNDGILALAQAAEAVLDLGPGHQGFSAEAQGRVAVQSMLHQQTQARCTLLLPQPETTAYDTVTLTTRSPREQIVIAGSGALAGDGLVAEGLFAAVFGRDVLHVSTDGAPLDALVGVAERMADMTVMPKAVIWAVPVTDDLAAHGMRPFRELTALVRGACAPVDTVAVSGTSSSSAVDLSLTSRTAGSGLMVDLGGTPVGRMDFTLERADGTTLRRTIVRNGSESRTRRFLMPLDELGATPQDVVRVEVADVLGPAPAFSLCEV